MKDVLHASRSRNGNYRMSAVISRIFSKLVHSHYSMFALMSTAMIVDGEGLSRGQSLRKCSALGLVTPSTSTHQVEYY
jgi:hypothetical protein